MVNMVFKTSGCTWFGSVRRWHQLPLEHRVDEKNLLMDEFWESMPTARCKTDRRGNPSESSGRFMACLAETTISSLMRCN